MVRRNRGVHASSKNGRPPAWDKGKAGDRDRMNKGGIRGIQDKWMAILIWTAGGIGWNDRMEDESPGRIQILSTSATGVPAANENML